MATVRTSPALDAFVLALTDCHKLLGQILVRVDDHLGLGPDEVHWGHVGDANRLRDLLEQAEAASRGEGK
jgi:hypothetical protein